MYSDKIKNRKPLILLILILIVVIGAFLYWAGRVPARDINEESASAVKSAVARSAMQCYVVEGAYPSDLAYLKENYGLQINTRDFYVTYEAFASNLPPDIRVTQRKGDSQ